MTSDGEVSKKQSKAAISDNEHMKSYEDYDLNDEDGSKMDQSSQNLAHSSHLEIKKNRRNKKDKSSNRSLSNSQNVPSRLTGGKTGSVTMSFSGVSDDEDDDDSVSISSKSSKSLRVNDKM